MKIDKYFFSLRTIFFEELVLFTLEGTHLQFKKSHIESLFILKD